MFDSDLAHEQGYLSHSDYNVQALVRKSTGNRNIPSPCLCDPSVSNGRVLTGSSNTDTTVHFLSCFDFSISKDGGDHNPMVACAFLPERVNFAHWLTDSLAVCATGTTGRVRIFSIDASDKVTKIHQTGVLDGIHDKTIREISRSLVSPGLFASGGYDGKLCVTDVKSKKPLASYCLDKTIGSVKWEKKQTNLIGCTIDDGKYMLYDLRAGKELHCALEVKGSKSVRMFFLKSYFNIT